MDKLDQAVLKVEQKVNKYLAAVDYYNALPPHVQKQWNAIGHVATCRRFMLNAVTELKTAALTERAGKATEAANV